MADIRAADEPRVRAFRIIAIAEAITWIALIVATIVKYTADAPGGVHVLGPTHGTLFLIYVFLALDVRARLHWDARTTLIVLADAVVPFGGFLVARRSDLR